MKEEIENFLAADIVILHFHDEIQEFGVLVNKNIAKIHNNISPKPTAGSALWSISANIFSLHRSILALCKNGWSLATPIILRTMVECYLNVLIITTDDASSEYFGFKYLFNFLKKNLNDKHFSEEDREGFRKQIDEGLKKLPNNIRNKAKDFIFKKSFNSYWYSPEYSGPTKVIGQRNDLKRIYALFSGATHGGLFGLNFLKGKPDDVHPNPRKDKFSQNFALIYSNKIMLDAFYSTGTFEGLQLQESYNFLRKNFLELKPLVKKL